MGVPPMYTFTDTGAIKHLHWWNNLALLIELLQGLGSTSLRGENTTTKTTTNNVDGKLSGNHYADDDMLLQMTMMIIVLMVMMINMSMIDHDAAGISIIRNTSAMLVEEMFASLFLFIGMHFQIFVRKFLAHLHTAYASPQKLAWPLSNVTWKGAFPVRHW